MDQRTCSIVGRARQCDPRIPDPKNPPEISRYHFLLDVNPPDVRIRDFGSLNGTYVNEKRIGGRKKEQGVSDVLETDDPEYDLHDGDVIRMVQTTIRVNVETPLLCCGCFTEISPGNAEPSKTDGEVTLCETCLTEARTSSKTPPPRGTIQCHLCEKDATGEVNPARQGVYLCRECRSQPVKLARRLLKIASKDTGQFPFSEYTVLAELSRNPTKANYLLRRKSVMQHKVLTLMLPRVPVDARMKAAFLNQLHQSQHLDHPKIEKIRGFGYSTGVFFLIKEHSEGITLAQMLESASLDSATAVNFTHQILDGLEYAHSLEVPAEARQYVSAYGWPHQALAPDKIWVRQTDSGWDLQIADFAVDDRFDRVGLAGLSRTGDTNLTPEYLPRVQMFDYANASLAADVWRAAACLYSMLTQLPPRDFAAAKDPWKVVLQTEPVPIRQRNPSVPESLAKVIDQALDDSRGFTFSTVKEFRQALWDAG